MLRLACGGELDRAVSIGGRRARRGRSRGRGRAVVGRLRRGLAARRRLRRRLGLGRRLHWARASGGGCRPGSGGGCTGLWASGGPGAAAWASAGAGLSNPTWMWSWCPASLKNPGAEISHGPPTSDGRTAGSRLASSVMTSRAAALPGPTGAPSTVAMSRARPLKWFETTLVPATNWSCPVLTTLRPIGWSRASLSKIGTKRGSMLPERKSARADGGKVIRGSSTSCWKVAAPPPAPGAIETSGAAAARATAWSCAVGAGLRPSATAPAATPDAGAPGESGHGSTRGRAGLSGRRRGAGG